MENQVRCTVKYVLILHYSLLYIIQYNVNKIGIFFPLIKEAIFASICVHYRVQYSVQYSIQNTVQYII